MEPSDVDTIEDILKEYDIDALIGSQAFEWVLAALKNRESVMIEDALSQAERKVVK
jgi:hypothetical protein